MKVFLFLYLLLLSISKAELPSSTISHGVSFAQYSVFKDKTVEGTQATMDKSALQAEYEGATTPSPLDRVAFAALESHKV
jgi:hypothetical protein